jgi:hypothetical protein
LIGGFLGAELEIFGFEDLETTAEAGGAEIEAEPGGDGGDGWIVERAAVAVLGQAGVPEFEDVVIEGVDVLVAPIAGGAAGRLIWAGLTVLRPPREIQPGGVLDQFFSESGVPKVKS